MRATRRDFCTGALSTLAAAAFPSSAHARTEKVLDLARDPRLSRRVRLSSEGMPVRRVLRALQEATGVKLSAVGRAGDQRCVAFVPEASLSEILACLAQLYRLEWSSDGLASPSYSLLKTLSASREEAGLRERAIRAAFDQLAARARAGGYTEAELKELPHPELPQALPHLLPLVESNLGLLLREGYVYVPLSRVAPPLLARLTTLLQPAFNRQNQVARQMQAHLNAERQAEGQAELSIGGADAPPPTARECTLITELRFRPRPTVWIGLRDPHSTQYPLLTALGDDLEAAGLALLGPGDRWPDSGRAPDTPVAPRGEAVDRTIALPSGDKIRKNDWIARLRLLSETAKLSIYTDCYSNFEDGMDGHPRGHFQPLPTTSLAAELDRLCRGVRADQPHSCWWLFQGAALVRSRQWLWDEETILPAELMERLVTSIRQTGRPSAQDLPQLARLTGPQILGNGYAEGRLDAWAYGVRVPARLSPASQARLLADGLRWGHLSPQERQLTLQLLPPVAGSESIEYSASFQSRPEEALSQGGTLLQTEVAYQWGDRKSDAVLQLAVPGVTSAGAPRPEALQVQPLE